MKPEPGSEILGKTLNILSQVAWKLATRFVLFFLVFYSYFEIFQFAFRALSFKAKCSFALFCHVEYETVISLVTNGEVCGALMSDTNESSGKWCLVFILQQQSFYFNFSNLQLTLPPSPLAIIITIIVQQFLFCFVSSDEAWPRHKWFSNDFIRSKKIYFSEVGHFNHKDWRKYNLKPCYLQNWTCLWSSIIFKIISLLLSSESWYLRLKPRVVLREWNYQLRPETPGWWSELGVDCLFDGYLRLDNVRLREYNGRPGDCH